MNLAVYLLLRAIVLLPPSAVRATGLITGRLACLLAPGLAAGLPMKNLERVRPGLSRRRKKEILLQLVAETLVNFSEAARMHRAKRLKRLVRVTGLENLEEALARGKGVILLSAHLGNFPLILAVLRNRGLPVNHIGRNPSNPWLSRYFDRVRKLARLPVIPLVPSETATRSSAQWLRKGGALSLPADQYNSRGVDGASFFGYRRGTPAGPTVLARRLGCAVVPVFITREGRKHRLRIYPPLKIETGAGAGKDRRNAELFNRVLEREIRAEPGQWLTLFTRRFR